MKPVFKEIILREKGQDNWEKFSKKVEIEKSTIHGYIYGQMQNSPNITALKKFASNTSISPREIQDSIYWDKNLDLLTQTRLPKNKYIIKKGVFKFVDLNKFCVGLKTKNSKEITLFPLITTIIGNQMRISYDCSSSGGMKSKPFSVKRNIILNKPAYTAFGLIQAESCKKPGYGFFDFTNSDSILTSFIIEYFQRYWGVSRTNWKCFVNYWGLEFSKHRKKEIILFWKDKLKLPIENITVYHGTKSRRSIGASANGVASIRINNRAFRTVVIDFMNSIINKTLFDSNDNLGAYFTGLFSGDGTLSRHKGNFSFIGMAFDPHSGEIEHCHKLLKSIGIEFNKQHLIKRKRRSIFIHHWKDQLKLLKITNGKLFLDKRNDIFLNGFLNNQYIKPLIRLCELSNYQPITVKNYSKKYGNSERSAIDCLKRMEKLDLLYYDNKHVPFKFFLTRYGYDFVELINKLQRMKGD